MKNGCDYLRNATFIAKRTRRSFFFLMSLQEEFEDEDQ